MEKILYPNGKGSDRIDNQKSDSKDVDQVGLLLSSLLANERYLAYHEAGHVAAALHFGHKFLFVLLDEMRSHVRFYKRKVFDKVNNMNPLTRRDMKFLTQDMQVTLAGPVVESILMDWSDGNGAGNNQDLEHVSQIADAMDLEAMGIYDPFEYILQMASETRKLLSSSLMWNMVFTIANRLIDKKRLDYVECVAIYNQLISKDETNHQPFEELVAQMRKELGIPVSRVSIE